MTTSELRSAVEAAIDSVDFEPPPTVAYCQAVYVAINARLPPSAIVDVMHREVEVAIDVRVDDQHVEMTLPAV